MTEERSALIALDEAFRRHYTDVYRFLLRRTRRAADAEDLAQEVFTDAVAAVRNERPPRSVEAWLFATAHRRFIDHLRRQGREARDPLPAEAPAPVQNEHMWSAKTLCRLLGRLPDQHRQVVVMRLFEGHSTRDMAAALGTTEAAAKMRLSRALRDLRVSIGDEGIGP